MHDVQGLVARGYGNLLAARFVLLGIDNPSAGQAWLGTVAAAVTRADERPQSRAVQIALTSSGLEKLGLDAATVHLFSNEFADGMTAPHRSRNLGDLGDNSPEHWDWGGPRTPRVDAMLLLYAEDEASLDALEQEHAGMRGLGKLGTSNLDEHEPFGFRDGISQPLIEGLAKKRTAGDHAPLRRVRARLSERVRPLHGQTAARRPPGSRPQRQLPRLPSAPPGRSRLLELPRPGYEEARRQLRSRPRLRLAAKMVGRWPSGAPLALSPTMTTRCSRTQTTSRITGTTAQARACPVGAHIRRANPRDSLDPKPGTAKSWEINRRHRILRRGREYGSGVTPDEALRQEAVSADDEHGLHFICLNETSPGSSSS